MKLRVCLAGITGWVGKPLAQAIAESDDLELVAAVSRQARGQMLGSVQVSGTVEEALRIPSDVFVDYTSAESVRAHVLAAAAAGRHVVVGSSGLSDADFVEIDRVAKEKKVGVIAVGNYALTAGLLQRFAAEAARHLPSWEIIDYARDTKVDAPSGTARELAWRLSQVNSPKAAVALADTVGERASRGATLNGTQIHSVRSPGHVIGVEIIFGRDDERLTLRYDGGAGAGPYVSGTLMAVRRVSKLLGVARGLDHVL
jgi:4-hydroxy-tetrahydrodipicolinate reductase